MPVIGQLTSLYPGRDLLTSNTFAVSGEVSQIKIIGMRPGDQALVEIQVGLNECDVTFVPYAPNCCGELYFCYPQNEFYLGAPNVYRLVLSNRFGSHLTDPAWFENLKIYQTPVDSKYLKLSEGCDDMGCAQVIRCTPDGITIDGILCPADDTFLINVIPSASGWTLVMNDGTTLQVPLTSIDGSVDINGFDISVLSLCEQCMLLPIGPRIGG